MLINSIRIQNYFEGTQQMIIKILSYQKQCRIFANRRDAFPSNVADMNRTKLHHSYSH